MLFDPPGLSKDLDQTGLQAWSDWISDQFDRARARGGEPGAPSKSGPRPRFFNPGTTPPADDAITKDISWTAFPRVVQLQSMSEKQRWRTADSSRDVQDEYCEWSVTRDPQTDKITRVTFTTEGPEYWAFLARVNPAHTLELYQKYISPQVRMSDLYRQGRYNGRNRWNNSATNGAMHLIQSSNTLGAEIELAAAATIVRRVAGQIVTDAQQLIQCGAYGQPERHSDPFIGASVNELARGQSDITLANPVGLYIEGLSVAGWVTPDGSDPLQYWSAERGTAEKTLRASYDVPPSKGFVVGDIRISGRTIDFGAQIADFIRIKLTGLATRIGQIAADPVDGCVQDAGFARVTAPRSVAEALSDQAIPAFR